MFHGASALRPCHRVAAPATMAHVAWAKPTTFMPPRGGACRPGPCFMGQAHYVHATAWRRLPPWPTLHGPSPLPSCHRVAAPAALAHVSWGKRTTSMPPRGGACHHGPRCMGQAHYLHATAWRRLPPWPMFHGASALRPCHRVAAPATMAHVAWAKPTTFMPPRGGACRPGPCFMGQAHYVHATAWRRLPPWPTLHGPSPLPSCHRVAAPAALAHVSWGKRTTSMPPRGGACHHG